VPGRREVTSPPALPRSIPERLDIPAIGVHTDLMPLGLHSDGTVEVPPLDQDAPAGWYQHSVTPGEVGSAVILGHVDSVRDGPAVFYRLGTLEPGDRISVRRADRSTVTFVVDAVRLTPKTDFPTDAVYGGKANPILHLVTCGGRFDRRHGTYRDNLIVTASIRQ
jgi:sortase (surface protein transpeptidase)